MKFFLIVAMLFVFVFGGSYACAATQVAFGFPAALALFMAEATAFLCVLIKVLSGEWLWKLL